VSITVLDGAAAEVGADPGTVRFTRTGDLSVPLSASYTLSGSAINGTDYSLLGTTVSFGIGQATVDRVVTPVSDSASEGDETVVFTLVAQPGYDLGETTAGTITIADTPIPRVSVVAIDPAASETTGVAGVDTGTFQFTRTGDVSAPLVVNFLRTGTATFGAAGGDYTGVGTSVTFNAGQATRTAVVTPAEDTLVEGSETVIVTLVDGASYDLDPLATTATVTITD
jgi:hypothetical protein